MVDHIIWDWNGTLLDDVDVCLGVVNRMLARRGLPALEPDRYRLTFDFPVKPVYGAWGFDLDAEDWDRLAAEYHDLYVAGAADAPLRPGASDTIDALRERDVPMSILSSCEQGILDAMVAERGLSGRFETVRGQDNLHGGTKIELGRRLVRALNLPASRVVLVGDTTHDYAVAAAAGCACLLVRGGHQAEDRLRSCGCPVVDALAPAGIVTALSRVARADPRQSGAPAAGGGAST
jgi:phosphoglycolate phosphatase